MMNFTISLIENEKKFYNLEARSLINKMLADQTKEAGFCLKH